MPEPTVLCSIFGCGRPAYNREHGWCNSHCRRWLRTGDEQPDRPIGDRRPPRCSVESCDRIAEERGWCHAHYLRHVRLGDVQSDRPLGRQVNDNCTVRDCHNEATARGLCSTHRARKTKNGDVAADIPVRHVNGTGYIHHTGYRIVPVPPELRHLTDGETSAAEHRLVMAIHLGRPLRSDESIHHKNGDRLCNELWNLELWSRWQPSGQRVEDKLAWAREFMRRYAPHELAENLLL